MDMRLVACAGLLVLAGCSSDGTGGQLAAPGNRLVFESRQSLQCESDGISPETSAQKLVNAGIDVLRSTCGNRTGVVFPTVCGGPTGEILVHEIRGVNVEDAQRLGFAQVSTLVDTTAGTNYELIDCADRTPIPPPG